MKKAEAKMILAALMAHYPGVELTADNVNAYCGALEQLPAPDTLAAVTKVARREERFPSVAALLRAIGEILSGAPIAEDAWEEVRASFAGHYCYPHECDYGGWEASHPAIARAVKAIGYHALMNGTNPSADRAQFMRIYGEFRTQAARRAAAGELPAPVRPQIASAPAPSGHLGELRTAIAAGMHADYSIPKSTPDSEAS